MTADNYELNLDLFAPIVPEKSSFNATAHKVEINLAKVDGTRWTALEKKKTEAVAPVPKKKPGDWDKLSKEIEKTEEEETKVGFYGN
jgi:hypothetical protein